VLHVACYPRSEAAAAAEERRALVEASAVLEAAAAVAAAAAAVASPPASAVAWALVSGAASAVMARVLEVVLEVPLVSLHSTRCYAMSSAAAQLAAVCSPSRP
jgi:hypothetical protein